MPTMSVATNMTHAVTTQMARTSSSAKLNSSDHIPMLRLVARTGKFVSNWRMEPTGSAPMSA